MAIELPTSADQDFSAQFLKNRKRRRQRRILAVLAVIAAGGGVYYWQLIQAPAVQQDELLIATIGYGTIENAIPAAGELRPKEIVPVGARASGELEEIFVEVGDYVEEGQPLARIDAQEQRLRVESSEISLENQKNQVAQRELDLAHAINNYNRTVALHAAQASTDQELENAEKSKLNAEVALVSLKNQILQAEKSLEQERVQLDYTEIKAPLPGTIISLDQKEGATLNASQTAPTVMQIADLTTLTVETEISEADRSQVAEGIEVYFTTLGTGNRRWYAELRQVDPMPANTNNVILYKGRFDVENDDGALHPGMTTQVFFVTSRADNVLTVPLGALTFTSTPAANGAMSNAQGQGRGQMPTAEELAARVASGEITEEQRAQIEQFRANGGGRGRAGGGRGDFAGGRGRGDFGGRGGRGFDGGGQASEGGSGPTVPNLSASITLNEPRDATVQLVQPDGTMVTREIVVGATDSVNAEVVSGLVAGDRVVAGVIQARVEEEEQEQSNNRNNNNWGGRGMPSGMRGLF